MTDRTRPLAGLLAIVVLVAACSGGTSSAASGNPPSSADPPSAAPPPSQGVAASPVASADASTSAAPSPEPAPGIVLTQPWATASLTDVASGATFRIADLAGKVIFIETMAIWCTNCRAQQADAWRAIQELDDPNIAYVVLDTEASESAAELAAYERKRGWDAFTYAISPTEVSRALAAEFGDFVLNAPSTPIIVIGTDGTVTLTDFGHKSTDDLIALARRLGA